ncbi:MAG: RagB/SusD family nutrient uptake outer membrane protein [Saprospiraceae bacterium]
MKKINIAFITIVLISSSLGCKKEFLELNPRGIKLESNYYQTRDEIFQGVVAAYDCLQWGGTAGMWAMDLGLLNTASDDCYAGGSDASDQPNWVAWDAFTLTPTLGPQSGLWNKYYSGIYRCNLILNKIEEVKNLDAVFKARTIAELKFLRAYYYFDLIRFFGNIPLITTSISADDIYKQKQVPAAQVYAQIEKDLKDAVATVELPETVTSAELGRATKGAAKALLGKVILYQNQDSRMAEAATYFEEVINSNIYKLEPKFEDIFKNDREWGQESVFEINFSGNQTGGWENFTNQTEGNYNVQFCGMRDFIGAAYSAGWGFCPVATELVDAMKNDPRFKSTVIDGRALKLVGASYSAGFQNTDYFIRKYAPLAENKAKSGEPALNWNNNIRVIRFADVYLMAAEALVRANGDAAKARGYINKVRARVGLQPYAFQSGTALLELIYNERRFELATEGHRFFDLVRTGKAEGTLKGFVKGKSELLPIPQQEIDIVDGAIKQNPNY